MAWVLVPIARMGIALLVDPHHRQNLIRERVVHVVGSVPAVYKTTFANEMLGRGEAVVIEKDFERTFARVATDSPVAVFGIG
jgi:hypothetical protein